MRRASAAVIWVILVTGVLTAWIPARWPISILEVGSYALAFAWILSRQPLKLSLLFVPLTIVPVWACLQLMTHCTVAPTETIRSALNWLAYLALAFAATQTFESAIELEPFRKALLYFGATVATAATLQLYTSPHAIFWLFPIPTDLVFVMGPFLNHGQYAAFIALLLPVALRAPARGHLLIAGLMIASVVASASRAGTALIAIETAVLFFRARASIAVSLKIAIIAAGFTILVGWDALAARATNPDPGRLHMLRSSLDMIRDHPLTGVGLGNWSTVYPFYAHYDDGLIANQAHNDWAQWTAEGGLPLLACMLSLLGLSLRQAQRHPWATGAACVFIYALIDYPFQKPPLAALVFTLLAISATDRSPRHSPVASSKSMHCPPPVTPAVQVGS